MNTIIQISPILLTFTLLLVFRRPPIQAAIAGSVLVGILWLMHYGGPVGNSFVFDVASDTGVLFLSTAAVIAPGLAFVILIERSGANKAMAAWIESLGWSKAEQVVFIVLGLAPLLESMTGFGVSMIATVPLLLALFSRQAALRIALSGMVIMPWGTLGLATIIGAALASVSPTALGQASALVSAPVFLLMGGVALWAAKIKQASAWILLALVWSMFIVILFGVSRILGPEIAGVCAGLSVLCLGLLLARRKGSISSWPRIAWPYLLLLGVIIAIKIILMMTGLNESFVVTGKTINWQPLASPGLALGLVLIAMLINKYGSTENQSLAHDWAYRSWKPLATIFFFLLMSQGLLKGGFLIGFQQSLGQLSSIGLAPVTAALAGLSGYLTGSNVGGNAIFMPTIAHLPDTKSIWLMAIQNSGAGHGALGSLSILALITGLAKSDRQEEQRLIRFGFIVVCLNIILISITGGVLMSYFGNL